ncbi:hypothetical protein ACCO45_010603 [Purpureocillium lilacinum]|uniref:Uncharacterized protein n=1 Tax=Purpureocillium lilacinum TaxID=33203 RepID=A0ACC4DIB2_PURLI
MEDDARAEHPLQRTLLPGRTPRSSEGHYSSRRTVRCTNIYEAAHAGVDLLRTHSRRGVTPDVDFAAREGSAGSNLQAAQPASTGDEGLTCASAGTDLTGLGRGSRKQDEDLGAPWSSLSGPQA